MKHLGDITKIDGAKIEVVDVITGGSPCQDLSVAATKRAGLQGKRSGLFLEQIRIIKEMRKSDAEHGKTGENIRPRYMVWENVPGAFSSNKSEDFRIVLQETAKIVCENAVIPKPPHGKWRNAGCIMGNGWSISWRVLDAQFWGVPQRRRRIALVTDFGGQSAPKILFEHKGLCGDFTQSETQGKRTPSNVRDCTKSTNHERVHGCAGFSGDSGGKVYGIAYQADLCPTLKAAQNSHVVCFDCRGNGNGMIAPTITGDHQNRATDYTAICIAGNIINRKVKNGGNGLGCQTDISYTLNTVDRHAVATSNNTYACKSYNEWALLPMGATLKASGGLYGGGSENIVTGHSVRRLTPLECERLQGYPDYWTDIPSYKDTKGKNCRVSDTARYKALGNSIALPQWEWLLGRISAMYNDTPTLGSLFDGIGGFSLCWENINGDNSTIWASEIEEFPIAVTKYHFRKDY